ncbi:hypothetical protein BaRGS_00025253 [Batillaria attramentaria]|uniref:Uncharacterized protein n=1 Tax=Batillaria attramentaria TaxID=370345 RepID=A0ABD0K8Q6_9CAEN
MAFLRGLAPGPHWMCFPPTKDSLVGRNSPPWHPTQPCDMSGFSTMDWNDSTTMLLDGEHCYVQCCANLSGLGSMGG